MSENSTELIFIHNDKIVLGISGYNLELVYSISFIKSPQLYNVIYYDENAKFNVTKNNDIIYLDLAND